MQKWRKTHPPSAEEKRRNNCRSYLNVYVRRGKVQRKPCEICGRKDVEAFHTDLSKPLEVKWLCRKHHLGMRFPLLYPCVIPAGATGARREPSHKYG